MICLKNFATQYNMAIITGIDQPNDDVLIMFDKLYVLSKGGKCVFDGESNQLLCHLQECQINLQDCQAPINQLIKTASKTANVSFVAASLKINIKIFIKISIKYLLKVVLKYLLNYLLKCLNREMKIIMMIK